MNKRALAALALLSAPVLWAQPKPLKIADAPYYFEGAVSSVNLAMGGGVGIRPTAFRGILAKTPARPSATRACSAAACGATPP